MYGIFSTIPSTQITQSVKISAANSSTANLGSGGSFTGTAGLTDGYGSIYVSLKADIDCTVYIEQSPDGTNWDEVDTYTYHYAIGNFSRTAQVVNTYFRIALLNNFQVASTYFRLNTGLMPVANPLPRSLDEDGHLETAVHVIRDDYGFVAENSPSGELRVCIPTLLVGAIFDGTTVDTNFWTVINIVSGTSTQTGGVMVVASNAATTSASSIISVRRARFVPGISNVFHTSICLNNTGVSGNTRLWGIGWGSILSSVTDGAFFNLAGTTFGVTTLSGGASTTVSSGSLNGDLGAVRVLDVNYHMYEIYYTNSQVFFVVDGHILHTVTTTTVPWSGTMQLHPFLYSANGAASTNCTIQCRSLGIRRLGQLLSQPTSRYQSGTTAGVVLKYGPGNLHSVTFSAIANTSNVTLYNNAAASGTIIYSTGAMGNNTVPFSIDFKGLPFFTGLTLVIAGAASNVTVIYE